tara:strand:- start:1300 stop:2268 length:969 start_codon:yes stop_codon:yes gene_type:complete
MMTKHGYEDVSVKDIREELKSLGIQDEELLSQSKKPLVKLLLETKDKAGEDADILYNIDFPDDEESNILDAVDTDSLKDEESKELVRPEFNSEKWSEWVMSQFADDELESGAPTCDGLRRVSEQILGPIEKVEVIKNDTPSVNNKGNATVVVGVTISPVLLEGHPRQGSYIYVEDLADANKLNTPEEIFKHPSATAGTRAESRVYRKMLRLRKVLTAEELASNESTLEEEWAPSTPITEQQITVIDMLCKRTNMHVSDFINCGDSKYVCVEQVSEQSAQKMLQYLNRIQRKDADRPDDVGEYDENWKVKNDDTREENFSKGV